MTSNTACIAWPVPDLNQEIREETSYISTAQTLTLRAARQSSIASLTDKRQRSAACFLETSAVCFLEKFLQFGPSSDFLRRLNSYFVCVRPYSAYAGSKDSIRPTKPQLDQAKFTGASWLCSTIKIFVKKRHIRAAKPFRWVACFHSPHSCRQPL